MAQEITARLTKQEITARLTGKLVMASPSGSNGQIQFNDNGAFGGFGSYDKETEELTLPILKLTEPITEDTQAITLGYLNSTPAGGISALDITNWDTAFGWGDHAGLYDALGEADSVLEAHNLAFDHSLIATALQSETDPVFTAWDKSTGISITEDQISDLKTYIQAIEKGANNGVATLDGGGKIPVGQLPSTVMEFKGTWNATTNTPSLSDGTGDAGDIYLCSVAGTQDLGSGDIEFNEGDWVVYNGTVWQKSINSNAVVSVNGQQGVVSLDADDIDDSSTTNKFTTVAEKAVWNAKQDALGFTPENVANKKTTLTDSDSDYPTTRAVNTALGSKITWGGDNTASKGLIGTTSNQPIGFITNNTEKMTILANGNVGVGTTNPTSKLDIGATYSQTATMKIFDTNPSIILQRGTAVGSSDWQIQNNVGALEFSSGYDTTTPDAFRDVFFIFKSTGKVGIGTSLPTALLDVNGAISGLSLSTNSIITSLGSISSSLDVGSEGIGDGVFVSGKLQVSGNVGIGTTSPGAKLDIGGLFTPVGAPNAEFLISENVNERTGMEFRNTNTGTLADSRLAVSDTTDHYLAFSMPSVGNTQSALFGLSRSTTDFLFNVGGTTRDLAIGTIDDKALVFGQNNAEVMRLHTNGNVGIGTTAPSSPLSFGVNANERTILLYDSSTVKYGFGASGAKLRLFSPSNAGIGLGTISTSDGTTYAEKVTIDGATGNVGIGTTSPTAKLDVNSDILRLRVAKTPSSSGDTGNTGEYCWDDTYFYICINTNTWHRVEHATW